LNGPDKKTEFNLDASCKYGEHELFIFCVLLERFEMAKIFWQAGDNPICASLAASKLLKAYAERSVFENHEYYKKANEYEFLACDLLKICFEQQNGQIINKLLTNKVKVFGEISSLNMALSANAEDFILNAGCQSLFSSLWYAQIDMDNTYYEVCFHFYLFFIF